MGAYSIRLKGSGDDFSFQMIHAVSDSDSLATRFAETAGKSIFDLGVEEIDALRETVQRKMAEQPDNGNVLKVHNVRVASDGTQVVYNNEATRRAIYVARNPLDIVDSLADHMGRKLDDKIYTMANRQYRLGMTGLPSGGAAWKPAILIVADCAVVLTSDSVTPRCDYTSGL